MFQLKYLILIISILITTSLVILDKKKTAIIILFICLPFAAAPFKNSDFFEFRLGLSAFIIWAIWSGQLIKTAIYKRIIRWDIISPKLNFLYYFLVVGFVTSFFYVGDKELTFGSPIVPMTSFESQINYTLFIITTILFLKIMAEYFKDYKFQEKLIIVFISTSFIQFGSFILSYFGFERVVPKFLLGGGFDLETFRFTGLLDDYELIVDYSLIVVAFSIILLIKGKKILLSVCTLLTGGMIGLLSGTRSFFIILGIFIITLFNAFLVKFGITMKFLRYLLIGVNIAMTIILVVPQLSFTHIILDRSENAISYLKAGDLEKATNRDWIRAIPIIAEKAGIFGIGSLCISEIKGDYMVSHNLYYGIYAMYGIIGLIGLLYLLFVMLSKLYLIIKESKNTILVQDAIVLFALFVSLLIQQIKVSAIRHFPMILIYTFLLFIISSLSTRYMETANGTARD